MKYFFCVLFLGLFCCKQKNEITPLKPFIGTWNINEVMMDQTLQNDWVDTKLSVLQEHMNSGTYKIQPTYNDRVFPDSGSWTYITEDDIVLLNDTNYATFKVQNDKLHIKMALHNRFCETPNINNEDSVIFLPVVCQWDFKFKKIH